MTVISDSIELPSFEALTEMIVGMIRPLETPKMSPQTWQEVIDVLQEMERGYFASSSGPDGAPWAANRPYTVAKKGHGIVLRETHELEESLTGVSSTSIRRTTDNNLEFGTNRAWSWLHQDGGKKLPQRMHVGMNDEGLDDVLDIVADAAVRMMFN